MQKTIKFYTLGCKVNQYDTQALREQFLRRGFRELNNGQPAQVYLINTCTVTGRADSESLNLIRRARKENPCARIIVTGCLAELDAGRIRQVNKDSLIIKHKDQAGVLNRLYPGHKSQVTSRESQGCITYFRGHTRAFLKIQDGCDNSCAYCRVPLARGRPRSKPLKAVIREAESLVKTGFREIVLCGVCLGAWGRDFRPVKSLADVITELEKLPGLLRLRLSSIEARDVSDQLIAQFSRSKILCPHLHLPIQSGDDEILKLMQRRYRSVDYLKLVNKLKKQIPGIAITTDCLVGFPGEEERHFQHTLDLVRRIMPLKAHIFPYSARPGTKAAGLSGRLAPEIIKQRCRRLRAVAEDCALKYKRQFLNKELNVLIEGRSKSNPLFLEGHSDNYIKVLARDKRDLKNQRASVKIEKIYKDYTEGIFVDITPQ